MSRADRGVAPVVSTVLLVAVTVVLAATISVFALGFGTSTETAPVVGESSGTFEAFQSGSDEQIVRIRHVAGDTVPTDEMAVVVDASDACDKTGRLVDLPLGSAGASNTISPGNVEGDDIFDNSYGAVDHGALTDDVYDAGDVIRFRIAKGDCEVDPDETLVVSVVHTPTNAVVITERLQASPS